MSQQFVLVHRRSYYDINDLLFHNFLYQSLYKKKQQLLWVHKEVLFFLFAVVGEYGLKKGGGGRERGGGGGGGKEGRGKEKEEVDVEKAENCTELMICGKGRV